MRILLILLALASVCACMVMSDELYEANVKAMLAKLRRRRNRALRARAATCPSPSPSLSTIVVRLIEDIPR